MQIKFIDGQRDSNSKFKYFINDFNIKCLACFYTNDYKGTSYHTKFRRYRTEIIIVKQESKTEIIKSLVHELCHWVSFLITRKMDGTWIDDLIDKILK